MTHQTHRDIREEVAFLESIATQIRGANPEEKVDNVIQEVLSELKAASERLLQYAETSLPGLIRSNDEVWRSYKEKAQAASTVIRSLL